MAGVAQQPGRRQSNSHIVALLSLKILLLAFFILLNALASFEDNRFCRTRSTSARRRRDWMFWTERSS